MAKKIDIPNNITPKKENISISEATSVYLSVKTIFVVIAFIIGFGVGFYHIVISPKFDDLDKRYYMMHGEQKEMFAQIMSVNNNVIELKTTLKNFTNVIDNRGSTYYLSGDNCDFEYPLSFDTIQEIQFRHNLGKMYPLILDSLQMKVGTVTIPLMWKSSYQQ